MKSKTVIIFLLIIAAFGAGIYFKDDAIRLYENFNAKIEELQNADFGSLISEAGKEFLAPPPLKVGRPETQAVLLSNKIVQETNLQRQENGLQSLQENYLLADAAVAKANDMLVKQYFEHVSPAGISPGQLVQTYGYDYIVAGENLILGNFSSEREVVDDWMVSPGHRANILNERFSEIGVAVVKGSYEGRTVWVGVQEFGLPLSVCEQPNEALRAQIEANKTLIDFLSTQIDYKKNQINNTSRRSPLYSQMVDDYNQLVSQYNSVAADTKQYVASYNSQVDYFNSCVKGN